MWLNKILAPIDFITDRITMYRLILYVLAIILFISILFSVLEWLPYHPLSFFISIYVSILLCWSTNSLFAYIFKAPSNPESSIITGLILSLIFPPVGNSGDLILLGWASIFSISAKYVLAISQKHIFNPVAIGAVLCSLFKIGSPSWWVGSSILTPWVFLGGFFITRKIRRESLVFVFLATVIALTSIDSLIVGKDITISLRQLFMHSSMFFFAFFMLTEPLTTPPLLSLQNYYGLLTGILFYPKVHFGPIFSTPELALTIGNIFSYLVSPKQKLILYLKEKIKIAPDIYDFIFYSTKKISFKPGQYLEWTLSHHHPDSRGIRRYFTISSSPTENEIRLGVKFYPQSSSFKTGLQKLTPDTTIIGAQLSGDFVLPEKTSTKLLFIAGGIGITPFRSMIKYLLDTNQTRDIVLIYTNRNNKSFVYQDIFNRANTVFGLKNINVITDLKNIPADWTGKTGRVNKDFIQNEVPDFSKRFCYLSGPQQMVNSFEHLLLTMSVPQDQIVKDYFPGLT